MDEQGSSPQGMGLTNRNKDSNKTSPKGVSRDVSDVASGSAQAGRGAARFNSGDVIGGSKDVVQGGLQATKGAKGLSDSAQELQGQMGGMNLSSGAPIVDIARGMGLEDNIEDDVQPDFSDIDSDMSLDDHDEGVDALGDSDSKDLDKGDKSGDHDSESGDNENSRDGKGMKDLFDDFMTDDASEVPDDVADDDELSLKSIRDSAAQAAATLKAAHTFNLFRMLLQFLKFLQGLMAKALAMISTTWAAIVGFAKGAALWVANVTGLSAVASLAVTVVSAVATGATAVALVVSSLTANDLQRYDDMGVCVPNNTSVANSTLEWESSGESSAMYLENLTKTWSVMSELGFKQEPFAAIMGNFTAESGLDPTSVETIYDEPYSIGPRKARAHELDYKMADMDPAYKARFPGVVHAGLGLSQWSNGRNRTFLEYADNLGLDWFEIGTQLRFMLEADNKSDRVILLNYANKEGSVEALTKSFMLEYLRPSKNAYALDKRTNAATDIMFKLKTMVVDQSYADSILSGINLGVAQGNHSGSSYLQNDGCGGEVADHYSQTVDGVGVFPAHIVPTTWSPKTLPSELKIYAKDPGAVMGYGVSSGWFDTSYPGQCVAFAHSFMGNLYGVSAPSGVNGSDVAKGWYDKHHAELGGSLGNVPAAGAVFSHKNKGVYGHTGVVDHVFANGDILVSEQNVAGVSGDNNGTPRTWGWRYFPAKVYQESNPSNGTYDWLFYKPDREPKWNGQ